jgi:uncharacterized membrane protein
MGSIFYLRSRESMPDTIQYFKYTTILYFIYLFFLIFWVFYHTHTQYVGESVVNEGC